MRHLIKKQELLLTISPGSEAFALQHEASRYYREVVLPVLERVFDELSDEEEVIRIDRLIIDLGRIRENSLQKRVSDAELYTLIRKEVQRVLKEERQENGVVRASARANALVQWWYYMEKGRLPWNAGPTTDEWYEKVLEILSVDYDSVTRLRHILEKNAGFLQRVSYQHTDAFLETLTGILTGAKQISLGKRVEEIGWLTGWLDNNYRKWTTGSSGSMSDPTSYGLGGRMPASRRKALIASLQKWAGDHSAVLARSVNQRKAVIWQFVLREAGTRTAAFHSTGAEKMLLRWLTEDEHIDWLLWKAEPMLPVTLFAFGKEKKKPGSRKASMSQETTGEPSSPAGERSPADEHSSPAGTDAKTSGEEDGPARLPDRSNKKKDGTGDKLPPGAKREVVKEHSSENPSGFDSKEVDEDGIYSVHAGLVLLHTQLPTLFSRANLWSKGGFASETARQQAIFLLHYLATGKQEEGATGRIRADEHALLFPKFLCDYSLELPLPGEMELPEAWLREADDLLEAVLVLWEKLKNSSVAALREQFLQRTGKLVKGNDRLTLLMEIQGIDVLLNYLPWPLSIVKLPWLKNILYVEWR